MYHCWRALEAKMIIAILHSLLPMWHKVLSVAAVLLLLRVHAAGRAGEEAGGGGRHPVHAAEALQEDGEPWEPVLPETGHRTVQWVKHQRPHTDPGPARSVSVHQPPESTSCNKTICSMKLQLKNKMRHFQSVSGFSGRGWDHPTVNLLFVHLTTWHWQNVHCIISVFCILHTDVSIRSTRFRISILLYI